VRIRLFCDIEVPDQEGSMGDPKDWDWHRFLNLGTSEKIWVYGAKIQHDPVDTTENPDIIQATPTGDQS
jgi:hypothetical protein